MPPGAESDVFYARGNGGSSLFWNKQMKSSIVWIKEKSQTYRNSNLIKTECREKGIRVFYILLKQFGEVGGGAKAPTVINEQLDVAKNLKKIKKAYVEYHLD